MPSQNFRVKNGLNVGTAVTVTTSEFQVGDTRIHSSGVVAKSVTVTDVTGISTISSLKITGALYDRNNNVGAASSVLISTGIGVSWIPIATAALQGVQGIQGTQGVLGTQGTTGSQGTTGTQGTTGAQGTTGTQGATGPVGGSSGQVLYNSGGTATSSSNLTFDGTTFRYNNGYGSAATVYGCRAWVNFNGTGTPSIRASGNVSSISDNGTGDYTVNFDTSIPDTNYTVLCTQADGRTDPSIPYMLNLSPGGYGKTISINTSSLRVYSTTANGQTYDALYNYVAIFR